MEKEIQALEKALAYLIRPTMTKEEKIKALSNAFFRAHNAGYGDMIAGKLMAGIEDAQTEQYERDCAHRYEIEKLLELLQGEKE